MEPDRNEIYVATNSPDSLGVPDLSLSKANLVKNTPCRGARSGGIRPGIWSAMKIHP